MAERVNRERELLKRLVSAELNDIFDLLVEAQELLAQPEHIVDVTDMVEPCN